MKVAKQTTLLASLLLLLFVPAFAKTPSIFAKVHNRADFFLSQPATLAGVQLSPGDYQLKWEGEGEGARFTILREDRVVGTAVGAVLNEPNNIDHVATHLRSASNGSVSITQIETPTKLLVFEPNTEVDSASR